MKKIILLTALTLGGLATAQTTRANAPDAAVVDFGVTSATVFNINGSTRPALGLYANVSLTERLAVTRSGGTLWGTVTAGNSYNDLNRLFVDGRLDYNVQNVTIYGAVRQGFYANNNFGNLGTNFRLGTQVRF